MHKLKYCVAKNKYGTYCIPESSKHRISARTVLRGDVWEEETVDFILSCCKEDIIHAGAYFGDMLPAFSAFKKVWTFEPNKENYKCATNTILWNNLSNVHLTNGALGKTSGTSVLLTEKNGKKLGGASQIVKVQSKHTEKVKTITIDEVISKDRTISIIHLDIEHQEQIALEGAVETIKRCSPILVLETKHQVPPSLQQFLKQQKYKLVGMLHKNVNTIWKRKI